jgi:hypothetical protein
MSNETVEIFMDRSQCISGGFEYPAKTGERFMGGMAGFAGRNLAAGGDRPALSTGDGTFREM